MVYIFTMLTLYRRATRRVFVRSRIRTLQGFKKYTCKLWSTVVSFDVPLFVLVIIARVMYVSSELPSERCPEQPAPQTSRHRLIRHVRRRSRAPPISSAGADRGRRPIHHNIGYVHCVETDHLVKVQDFLSGSCEDRPSGYQETLWNVAEWILGRRDCKGESSGDDHRVCWPRYVFEISVISHRSK
jgi:hypothetical protein